MLQDLLAKSVRSSRRSDLLGVWGEDFDFAARSLHYPLTPEVRFQSISELRKGMAVQLKQLGQDAVETLSIHGHGKKYDNGIVLEMGDDDLHHTTLSKHAVEFKKIGEMMAKDGRVIFLHCFAGAAVQLMPELAKLLRVPVLGQIKLNNLSPVLSPVQNAVAAAWQLYNNQSPSKVVDAGLRTFYPNGGISTRW